jgi:PAS domain S-box-containing protein
MSEKKTRAELEVIKQSADEASAFAESIINTVREPLIALDQDLMVVKVSDSFYEFFKVKPEDTVGQLIYDLGNKQWNIPKLRELLESILPQKANFDNYEVEHTFATIGRRVMLLNARQVERALGKERIILLAIEDITERRQAEKVLAEQSEKLLSASEEKYRLLVENINDVFYILDKQGNITYVSPAVERFTKYKVGDLLGKPFAPIVYPDDLPGLLDSFNRLASGHLEPWEFRVQDKEGNILFVRQSSQPIYEDGRITGFTSLMVDITERKRVEDALKVERQRLHDIMEVMPVMVCLLTADYHVAFANRAFRDAFGESHGRRCYEYCFDKKEPCGFCETYNVLKTGKPHHWQLTTPDNAKVIDVYDFPFTEVDGSHRILGLGIDITERKKSEKERQRMDKLESVGLLAGGIAHDFNNILTAIVGNIGLAKMETQASSELCSRLEEAEKASMRAKDLTNQLLTFSKGGAPIKKLASLSELLKDTASFALRGSNVKCQFSIPEDLWHAEIDEGHISQVINNLVINAQQAMPSGGTLEVRTENITITEQQSLGRSLPLTEGNYVRIAVIDQGTGIPEAYLDKIFDPFFTTKEKGNGLGLATSFSIVHNHGGHISVESKLGAGSTFYIYLPASTKTANIEKKEDKETTPVGKARILVMDDEEAVREVSSRILKLIGYDDAEVAADGAEAIKRYREAMQAGKPFDAVILDLTIPGGMGGKETLKKLLEINPGVKAIVSSGYSDDSASAEYIKYGFSGVVGKPYTIGQMRQAMHDLLG